VFKQHAMQKCAGVEVKLHAFLTSTTYENMEASDHLHSPSALLSLKELPVPIRLEAGWNPVAVWTQWWKKL